MVTLSSQAQQISQVTATVNALPDVREDVVSSLKAQIASGEYKVNSADIADMMLRRHTADQIR
jgi:flagellar biosynthesis anti-sigma factor FlgM